MKVVGRRGEGGGSAQWGGARGAAWGRRRAMAPNAEIFK